MTESARVEELEEELRIPTVIRLEAHMIVQLLEYSTTLPTGVYPGKMWRAESKPGDPFPGVEVPGLKGKWIIGAYLPLDENSCQLEWLPLEVVPYEGLSRDITGHCYNEECLYLRLFGDNIDDVHHSPNCRGALLRRAVKAEADRDAQAALDERMREALGKVAEHMLYEEVQNVKAACKLDASSALQEFKERCWTQAIEASWKHLHLMPNGTASFDRNSIMAELRRGGK